MLDNIYLKWLAKGKAINNFTETLPNPLSDLAKETLKDPYFFDFLTLTKPYHQKESKVN